MLSTKLGHIHKDTTHVGVSDGDVMFRDNRLENTALHIIFNITTSMLYPTGNAAEKQKYKTAYHHIN